MSGFKPQSGWGAIIYAGTGALFGLLGGYGLDRYLEGKPIYTSGGLHGGCPNGCSEMPRPLIAILTVGCILAATGFLWLAFDYRRRS
jgi:hypothetical protein